MYGSRRMHPPGAAIPAALRLEPIEPTISIYIVAAAHGPFMLTI
jgi:hypothetical protein